MVYSIQQSEYSVFQSVWADQFASRTIFWEGKGVTVSDKQMRLMSPSDFAVALYKPAVPIDLLKPFSFSAKIPVEGNLPQVGILLGWADENNWLMIEILNGTHYRVINNKKGNMSLLAGDRKPIERPDGKQTLVTVNHNGKNMVLEINQKIETILPLVDFQGNQIGLVTRSNGIARFDEFMFRYLVPHAEPCPADAWVGLGTGMLTSSDGRILTTYDVIANAGKIRVKGRICNQEFVLPAEVVVEEEAHNLALLKISSDQLPMLEAFPLGWLDRRPVSDSKVYSMGYPHAVSSILLDPSIFEGKVLPVGAGGSSRMIEMPFRYGMMGAPVFDDYLNLIGIVSRKGTSLAYTEIVDFQENKRAFLSLLRRFDRSLNSPMRDLPISEKQKMVADLVVIIESEVFKTP